MLVLVVGGHRKIGNIYYCVKAQMTVDGKAPTENYRIKIEGLSSYTTGGVVDVLVVAYNQLLTISDANTCLISEGFRF